MRLRNIMFATDLSDGARQAYSLTADICQTFDATLHLVHFSGAMPPILGDVPRQMYFEAMEHDLRAEAVEQRAFENLRVRSHLISHRLTKQTLGRLEQEHEIDLMVTNMDRRTGLFHMLRGTSAERLVRFALAPVLVVNSKGTHDGGQDDRHVVAVPFDSPEALAAVCPVVRLLAAGFGERLRFVCLHDPDLASQSRVGKRKDDLPASVAERQFHERFAELRAQHLPGVDVTLESCQGTSRSDVLKRADHLMADLILIGPRGDLRDAAQNVTHEAPCSAFSVLSSPAAYDVAQDRLDPHTDRTATMR